MELSQGHAIQALRRLEQEMIRWTVLPIDERVLLQAASVIDEYGLRSLDAIQLGTALLANSSAAPVTLVVYDKRLINVARKTSLATLSP